MGPSNPIDEVPESIRLGHDDGRVLALVAAGEFAGEQLRGTADSAKGVLDLVGKAARELAHGVLQGHVALVPVDADEAVEALELDEQLGRRQRRDGVVDAHHPVGEAERRLALGERLSG